MSSKVKVVGNELHVMDSNGTIIAKVPLDSEEAKHFTESLQTKKVSVIINNVLQQTVFGKSKAEG